MTTQIKKITSNYRKQKNSTVIISFIGISFIFLAGINFIVDVPAEYLIGVSFAAFFFICADVVVMSATDEKPFKDKIYYLFLFFAVMSFLLLPILLPLNPILFNLMASSSESVSIASLGIVLVMINLKLWSAEEDFFNEIQKLNNNSFHHLNDLDNKLDTSYERVDESLNIAKTATKLADETTILSKEVLEMNKNLLNLIEEGETLEEIREKAKSYK